MTRNSFNELLSLKWNEKKFLCVGLDPVLDKIPSYIKNAHQNIDELLITFNKNIIDAVADIVCCFKPNSAFYEFYGAEGWKALDETIKYIHSKYKDIPVIVDAKRGDIGNTNDAYAQAIFDKQGADAVTMSPYLGKDTLLPFFQRKEKGVIILVRTSNPGAGEFQDIIIDDQHFGKKPLYQIIAHHVAETWNENNNCGVVVGATYPEEMKIVREIIGDMPILIPGVGAQGGGIDHTLLNNAKNSNNQGMIINVSRNILYASSEDDFVIEVRKEAEKVHTSIIKSLFG